MARLAWTDSVDMGGVFSSSQQDRHTHQCKFDSKSSGSIEQALHVLVNEGLTVL